MKNSLLHPSILVLMDHMKIVVYVNGYGDGERSHVSAGAIVNISEYDDELNWPFIGKLTFELLNQLEDENHHSMELKLTPEESINADRNNGRGYHSQLSRDWASNTQYLKDDTLYFRISVEVSYHKPWLECTV